MKQIIKTVSLLLFILIGTAVSFGQDRIPNKLHGFWQFHVDKKGKWNGMHIGENYVELNYNLIPVEKVTTIPKGYLIKVNDGDKATNVQVEILSKDSAVFKIDTEKVYHCKKYNSNPDVEILTPEKYVQLFTGKWFEMYKDVKTPFKVSYDTMVLNNQKWKIIWLGEFLEKKEYQALLERNGKYQLVYIYFRRGNLFFKNYQGKKTFTTKLTDDRSLYLASCFVSISQGMIKGVDVKSISADFEVQTEIPNNIKVCVSPLFLPLNKKNIQAAVSSQTERIVKRIVNKDTICDAGGLLSVFGTQDVNLGKTEKEGVKFSGIHDGSKYVTVRKKIKWNKGLYRVTLLKSGNVEGKSLPIDSIKYDKEYRLNDYEHTWVTMIFENLKSGKKWSVGSVAIPGKNLNITYNSLWFFVEIYGIPINFIGRENKLGLFYKDIPTVKVVYKNFQINDKKVDLDRFRAFDVDTGELGNVTFNKEKGEIQCEIGYQKKLYRH